jgi:microcystin-dependent protein
MRRSIRIKRKNGTAGLVNVEGDIFMAGEIVHYAGASAPVGWLKCNGAAVSRSTYAALFAAIGTLYGAGDGTTTFNIPDCRGEFLRGLDDGRGVDASRALGSAQAGDIQSHGHAVTDPGHGHVVNDPGHTHAIKKSLDGSGGANPTTTSLGNPGDIATGSAKTGITLNNATTGLTVANAGGTETRPRNVAALVLIKY